MDRRRFLSWSLVPAIAGSVALAPSVGQGAGQFTARRLRFTLTFSNPFARPLEQQVFWCYLPAQATLSQRLSNVHLSSPHRLHEDELGHRILELRFDRVPPLAQKIVNLTVEVEMANATQPEHLERPVAWLGAERFIESDDSRIQALAHQLRRSRERETVRAIYEWVLSNLTYAGYLAEDMGALQALLLQRGDCTEYANLVVALARANGLPARMVGGYVVDRDMTPRPQDYHNWAEVYFENAWRLVDAQKGNWMEPGTQYVAFRIYRDVAINAVGLAHRYRMQGDLQVTF